MHEHFPEGATVSRRGFLRGALGSAAELIAHPAEAREPVNLVVRPERVLRDRAHRFIGINLNYISDLDANRPGARPLRLAVQDLGVRWLRYPGGEKSDFHLWSVPPYKAPKSFSLGEYAQVPGTRMNFDHYIAIARAAGAEPLVVLGCDNELRTGRTRDQWLADAAAWVRYANVTRKYGVRQWEIGNENWHHNTGSPDELAAIVAEFSRVLKAVDPSIKLGASGNNMTWWAAFLPKAARYLDFVSLSLYNTWNWKGYDRYIQQPAPDLIREAREALKAIDLYSSANRPRLKLIVTEINSKDYSQGGWPSTNTLGHAIVTFDTLGTLMSERRIAAAMVWTSRWMNDNEARESQWYALGPANEILPTGRAIALWGQFLKEKLVDVEVSDGPLRAYASCSAVGNAMAIWIINQGFQPVKITRITIHSQITFRRADLYRFSGTGPEDPNPRWGWIRGMPIESNRTGGLSCSPVSVSILSLQR